jgi:alkanesulfonate monooxygenase SsuD/methylene tetrahydromethanopterin reductase-like flavin-dependent oxidoreductase (luciferase family)
VKIGLVLPLFSGDTERVLSFARRAEELGFDGLFAFDHLFPPGAPPERPSLEAFTTLSAVAAETRSPKVGTLVARASLRGAGLLAKLAVSVDVVSGGRMILGIGAGDVGNEAEHRVFGVPRLEASERRPHLVETVDAVRALLRGNRWDGGNHVPSMPGPIRPRPAAAGGPPIWIGGTSDATVRVAARHADAWNGWGLSVEAFAGKVAILRDGSNADAEPTWGGIVVVGRDEEQVADLMRERERKRLPMGVWSGTPRALHELLGRLGSEGASWAVLGPGGPDQHELIAGVLAGRRSG